MASSTYFEIESFISKFTFLTSHGYLADLRFSNLHGKINVEFKANLGTLNTTQDSQRRMKPSRIRRRQRRKENREKVNNSSTETMNSDYTTNLIKPVNYDDQKNLNFVLSESNLPMKQYSSNVSDVSVQTTDVHQVDATVLANVSTPLKSSFQTDTVNDEVPQLQLFYDKDGIPRNPHLSMPCDATSSEDQCTFCSVILYN